MWQGIKNIYHLFNAVLANVWYRFPSKKLTVIGVTGTDGKTTTVNLIYHILKEAGQKVSMLSTVKAVIGKKEYDTGFHVTTPSPWLIQELLRNASKEGSEYMILETTSHAIDQYRVWGVDFAIGVLTNVTHEHLDYHKTYENYVKTKAKLLKKAKIAIVNRDDESFNSIKYYVSSIKYRPKADEPMAHKGKLVTYGMDKSSDINPKNFSFKTNLLGEFNIYNCLAAIAVCKELGVKDEVIRKALLTFKSPLGRQDIVFDKNFKVMIDFAHTPNAIEQILSEVFKMTGPTSPKASSRQGKIIHVFGSAGERDDKKRPLMGEVSSKYSDVIILTAEDPRSESVGEIMEQIESGIIRCHAEFISASKGILKQVQDDKRYLFKIKDRQEAIDKAIEIAEKGDFVVVTGKGHEKSMNYGRGEVEWSDYEAVRKALEMRNER